MRSPLFWVEKKLTRVPLFFPCIPLPPPYATKPPVLSLIFQGCLHPWGSVLFHQPEYSPVCLQPTLWPSLHNSSSSPSPYHRVQVRFFLSRYKQNRSNSKDESPYSTTQYAVTESCHAGTEPVPHKISNTINIWGTGTTWSCSTGGGGPKDHQPQGDRPVTSSNILDRK